MAALAPTEHDMQLMLAAQVHLGTKNVTDTMAAYVYKRRADGTWSLKPGPCVGPPPSTLVMCPPVRGAELTFGLFVVLCFLFPRPPSSHSLVAPGQDVGEVDAGCAHHRRH